jgi:hypothetical protein
MNETFRVLRETTVASVDPDIQINENEVAEIISSIKEAQYFDASSMAPLSPASIVGTPLRNPRTCRSGCLTGKG